MMSFAQNTDRCWLWVFLAWLVAMVSTLGALFLGEVMGIPPVCCAGISASPCFRSL